jgi:hypothetical protein
MAKDDLSAYNFGRTDNLGNIQFIDTFHIFLDSVYLTVSGRNLLPYTLAMKVPFVGGPYIEVISYSISDSALGNNDSIVNPGENIEIPLWVKNYGDSAAYNVSGVIRSAEPDLFIEFSDTLKYFGDMPPLDSAFTSADGYNVFITNNCPDMHEIELRLKTNDAGGSAWNSFFRLRVHAPRLRFTDYYNPSGGLCVLPGDTSQLITIFENIGSYKADNTVATISVADSFVTLVNAVSFLGTILPDSVGSNQTDPFLIFTAPQTPLWHPVGMRVIIMSGVYVDTFSMTIVVGKKDYLVWDADPNQSSGPTIKLKLDSLDFSGDYKTAFPKDSLSYYKSLFACLGIYPNNCIIRDTSHIGFEIQRYLTTEGGKVYLEGGDVWWADPHNNHGYDFCPLFKIDPVSNTIGSFPGVIGETGTFTENMLFRYQGETIMIDYIDSTSGSALIFRTTSYNRGCAVAADHRTVGMSFEFGGLVDTVLPSTKLALMDSIMRYFGLSATGVCEGPGEIVQGTVLSVYPNPFRNRVKIYYALSARQWGTVSAWHSATQHSGAAGMRLKIYDAAGRLVKSFALASVPLTQSIVWQGDDDAGHKLPLGVYFVQLEGKNFKITEKVILLR